MPKILSDTDLIQVRQLLRDGVTHQAIADDFGVSRTTITNVATREGLSRTDWGDGPPPLTGSTFELLRPKPWMDDALCAQADPDTWFPEKGGGSTPAVAICRRCPVAAECLDYALTNGERFGTWGGVGERSRRKLTHPNPAA